LVGRSLAAVFSLSERSITEADMTHTGKTSEHRKRQEPELQGSVPSGIAHWQPVCRTARIRHSCRNGLETFPTDGRIAFEFGATAGDA
jgi:hypothetical protein